MVTVAGTTRVAAEKDLRAGRATVEPGPAARKVLITPLCPIAVEYRQEGVTRLELPAAPGRMPAAGEEVPPAFLQVLERELGAYLAGERVTFSAPLALEGLTPFQARVLAACRDIPYGEVRTYGWLAARVGRPGAARAVGQVMACNPVSLLIPCHRVVAAGGRLGGFGAGPDMKAWLLTREGART